jgi:hypothetical protein
MAAFDKLPSGRWRVQVRRKGQHASRTFRLKSEAEAWANEAESQISRGNSVDAFTVDATTTFGAIIELHTRQRSTPTSIPLMPEQMAFRISPMSQASWASARTKPGQHSRRSRRRSRSSSSSAPSSIS